MVNKLKNSKLFNDNLILLIGGNVANVFSFLLLILLFRTHPDVASSYTAFMSVVLILSIPGQIIMRMFTVYGDSLFKGILTWVYHNSFKSWMIVFFLSFSTIPISFLIMYVSPRADFTIAMIVTLVIFSMIISYGLRGLRQFEDNFFMAMLALNLETIGRFIFGYILCFVFDFGINGVMIGTLIAMTLSIIPSIKKEYFDLKGFEGYKEKISHSILNSALFTIGAETFTNFDTAYILKVYEDNNALQNEFAVLQFYRKIIFYGIFTLSSLILSIASKGTRSKLFVFLFTLGMGISMGGVASIIFYEFKDFFFSLLNQKLLVVHDEYFAMFLMATTFLITAYLLANILLSKKRIFYSLIPIIAVLIQIPTFLLSQNDIESMISAYTLSTASFLLLCIVFAGYDILKEKFQKNG